MECQKDLKNIEARMNVLFPKSQSVSQELRVLDSKIAILTSEIDYFEKEKDKHERELRLINETSSKYWDTDRITGIPQRFLMSVISAQLKRIQHETIVSMEMRRTEMDELTKQRQAEKWIFDSDPTNDI
jgi:predicted Ser/Thr protein kinase